MVKVFIDGNVGTTGLRIEERLSKRDDIELFTLPEDIRKDSAARKDALNKADIAFLCLPDAAAIEAVEMIENPNTKVIDTSTAHRTDPNWAYGFPELNKMFKENLKTSKRVAVPGCHASGFLSIVYPLVKNGLVPSSYPFVCYSLTGYSGGGKKMIAEYKDENRPVEFDGPRQYAFTQMHKHLPEMKKIAGLDQEPIFAPIVGDFYSGMEVSVPLFGKMINGNKEDVYNCLCDNYKDSKLIKVLPLEQSFMSASEMSLKDSMNIYVGGNDERIMVVSLFDNLGKGASGAAIQCMNIMCDFDETKSLNI